MDIFDIQIYTIIKLLLLLFIAVSLFLIYKSQHPVYFLVLVGAISALAYALLVDDLQLSLWGLQGDELTIAAMYNTFAHGSFFNLDFAYHHLPPFYPPLYFWLFGLVGKLMVWNGVLIAKLAAFSFFLLFPVGIYYFAKYVSKEETSNDTSVGKIFILLAPLLIITVLDKDLLIGKPYEVVAMALTIFWYVGLYLKITTDKWRVKTAVLYGLIAGIIFMTYYLWLIFATTAFILMGFIEKRDPLIKYFWRLFQTTIIALLVSAVYWLPLLISYLRIGMENWQTSFFTPAGLSLWLPMFEINSINGLILLFGLGTLIYYRNNKYIRQLIYLFLTAFIWWGLGLASMLLFYTPLQEFRGFYILAPSILVVAAAYGIEKIWYYFNVNENKNLFYTLTILGILYFSTQSMFGFFIDDPVVKNRRVESKNTQVEIVNLVDFLQSSPGSSTKLTLLTTPQIMAFVPINNLIYFNQHNNHPAAIFSKRFTYVQTLANAESAQEFYEKIESSPFGKIEQLIFYSDNKYYYLYFHLDKMIEGIEVATLKIDKELLATKHFQKVYEKNKYVVINVIYN